MWQGPEDRSRRPRCAPGAGLEYVLGPGCMILRIRDGRGGDTGRIRCGGRVHCGYATGVKHAISIEVFTRIDNAVEIYILVVAGWVDAWLLYPACSANHVFALQIMAGAHGKSHTRAGNRIPSSIGNDGDPFLVVDRGARADQIVGTQAHQERLPAD